MLVHTSVYVYNAEINKENTNINYFYSSKERSSKESSFQRSI